jgi:hypothetical protein
VIAVGSDAIYLVAKRRDKSNQIWFYYIEKSKDDKYLNSREITKGPFNEQEFSEISKELGLPPFEKVFN